MNKKCDVCASIGHLKATNRIQIIEREEGDIILYLCKSCTKLFDELLEYNTNKKTLEQQAVGPGCSNVKPGTAEPTIWGITS
jgi:hypothetical protein